MNLKDPALIEERIILRKATTWLMLVLKQPSPDGLDAGPRPSSAHSRNAARRVDRSDHGGGHVRHHVPVRPAMTGRGRRLLGDRVDPPQAAQAAAIATLRLRCGEPHYRSMNADRAKISYAEVIQGRPRAPVFRRVTPPRQPGR